MLPAGLAHGPSLLFVAEVANQYIRGGLGAAATALGSMGEYQRSKATHTVASVLQLALSESQDVFSPL